MNILLIQSAVVFGHVGNSAAVFPLQRLGAEAWTLDTVQFSNHPGHGRWTGTVYPGSDVDELVRGLAGIDVLGRLDAVLSGYVGEAAAGEATERAVAAIRAANPRAIYACDPVIGDDGPGVYVRPGIAEHFRDRAVPAADILTPNQFELGWLARHATPTIEAVAAAAGTLRGRMHAGGPRAVLVTSVGDPSGPPDTATLLALGDRGLFRLRTPRLPIAVNGAGDMIAALFLFHLLRGGDVARALECAASSVFGVIERTHQAGGRELLMVAAQDEFVAPTHRFAAERLGAA